MAGKITAAYSLLVSLCADDTNQYSQTYRYGQTVGGITYWDCSSIISYVLTQAGFFGSNPWFTTVTEDSYLLAAGFSRYAASDEEWQDGDVLWRSGHTEMLYSASMSMAMGARSSSYSAADQVAIHSTQKSSWTYLYRAKSIDTEGLSWQAKETGAYGYNTVEAITNATLIYSILYDLGWTLNAVCGLLGNIDAESGYNPWRWQNDDVQDSTGSPWTSIGYGLVQFTPASKYIDDSAAKSYTGYAPNFSDISGEPEDGEAQIRYLNDYADYYPTDDYPLTYEEYKKSTAYTAAELAVAWLHNYERPADPEATRLARETAAAYWYGLLGMMDMGQVEETADEKKKPPMFLWLRPWWKRI